MTELLEYHESLLGRLSGAASEFRRACLAVRDPTAPIEPGGWSVHQVAAHTRDVEALVYGERARRTLLEDRPRFMNFDGDAYMAQHYDRNEPLVAILDGLVGRVNGLVAALHNATPQSWARQSSHESQGDGLTLQTWVERGLAHILEHLETVQKAAQ